MQLHQQEDVSVSDLLIAFKNYGLTLPVIQSVFNNWYLSIDETTRIKQSHIQEKWGAILNLLNF